MKKKNNSRKSETDENDNKELCMLCMTNTATKKLKGVPICSTCYTIYHDRDPTDYQASRLWRKYNFDATIQKLDDVIKLREDLIDVLKEYLFFMNSHQYYVTADWIMMTYQHKLFSAYPFLLFTGLPGGGKTLATQMVAELSYKGSLVETTTSAALRRLRDKYPYACIGIDQLERRLGYNIRGQQSYVGVELESIILSAYRSGGKEILASEKNQRDIEVYSGPYGPRVMDSVRAFNEEITSRSIVMPMFYGKPNKFSWQEDYIDGKVDELRNRLMAFKYWDGMELKEPGYGGRLREIVLPFYAIQETTQAASCIFSITYLEKVLPDYHGSVRAEMYENTIIRTIQNLIDDGMEYITLADIKKRSGLEISRKAIASMTDTMGLPRRQKAKVGRAIHVNELRPELEALRKHFHIQTKDEILEIEREEAQKKLDSMKIEKIPEPMLEWPKGVDAGPTLKKMEEEK